MKGKHAASVEEQAAARDWGELRRRVEAAQSVLERGFTPAPEEQKRILRERATALAREPETEGAAQESLEVIEFLLAYETYGIESSCVREVYPLREFTPLPCTPPFVLGVINVRGQILAVIDIKKFFDLPEKGLTDLNKVIIVHNDRMEFGLLADVIVGIRHVSLSDLQPGLPTLTDVREAYLKGITTGRVVILDAEKLLSDQAIVVHEDAEV